MTSRLLTFLNDNRGQMSIEFAIWTPFICFLLVLVTDTSFMYLGQNQMWAAARDSARRLNTIHGFTTTEAEDWAKDRLTRNGLEYDVVATMDDNYIEVVVTTPIDGVIPFGLFHKALLGDEIVARVIMRTD